MRGGGAELDHLRLSGVPVVMPSKPADSTKGKRGNGPHRVRRRALFKDHDVLTMKPRPRVRRMRRS